MRTVALIVPCGTPSRSCVKANTSFQSAPRRATRASGGRSSARSVRGCGRSRARSRTASRRSARRRPRSGAPRDASRAGARTARRPRRSACTASRRVERDRPLERIGEVPLALDAVLPGRRVRVLEVGHEDLRARVERVDHHLPVDRAGDLDAPVGDLVGERRDPPVASRTSAVSGRKSGSSPPASRSRRSARRARLRAAARRTRAGGRSGRRPRPG